MAQLHYLTGDATEPTGDQPAIIAHCCNWAGIWGAGFVIAVSAKWDAPEREYLALNAKYEDRQQYIPLGMVQLVQVDTERPTWVANVIGQVAPGERSRPVDYDALRRGLARVAAQAQERGASVHMPRLGAGMAGGEWPVIEGIITETIVANGVDAYVYDLPANSMSPGRVGLRRSPTATSVNTDLWEQAMAEWSAELGEYDPNK